MVQAPGSRSVRPLLQDGDVLAERYRLFSPVDGATPGDDGPAALWLADDEVLARPVAVKVISAGGRSGAGAAKRFLEAAAAAGAVSSPVLARVYDAAIEQRPAQRYGRPSGEIDVAYVVSEWVDGPSLTRVLAEDGPFVPADAVALATEIGEALDRLHAGGLHHGRLHPGNVLLPAAGGVKVTDLAVSAVLPDQAVPTARDGDPDSQAADVRDLAALLYACLTGWWPASATPQTAAGMPAAPTARDGKRDGRGDGGRSETGPRRLGSRLLTGRESAEAEAATSVRRPARAAEQPARDGARAASGGAPTSGSAGAHDVGTEPHTATLDTATAEAADASATDHAVVDADARSGPGQDRRAGLGTPGDSAPPLERRGRLISPRQARAGVPRTLDAVVTRALDPVRSGQAPSLRSAAGLVAALEAAMQTDAPPRPTPPRAPRTPRWVRRLVPYVLSLAFLVAVGFGAYALGKQVGEVPPSDVSSVGSGPSAAPAPAGGPVQLATPIDLGPLPVSDFDPPPGGGSENPGAVANAHDGDLSTVWTTERYNSDSFGGLKDGVGLLVDLQTPTPLAKVEVLTTSPGAVIELRGADVAGATAADFPVLARSRSVGDTVTLTPAVAANVRYVLVWITGLPRGAGGFQAGVAELRFTRG